MKTQFCTTYGSISLKNLEVGDIVNFSDGEKYKCTYKTVDPVYVKTMKYFLAQANLTYIKKNGKLGKRTVWLKDKIFDVGSQAYCSNK